MPFSFVRACLARFSVLFIALQLTPALGRADCGSPASPAEFLECAAKNDPSLISARAEVETLRGAADSAGLWQNPELSGDLVRSGSGEGEKLGLTLLQSLPVSGERGHFAREAALRLEAGENRLKVATQLRMMDWVVQLVRLRQVDEEMSLLGLQEELGRQALARLERLPFLTAEQQAAKKTFDWNQGALQVTKLRLEAERAEIRQGLAASLGAQPNDWNFIIPHKEAWPEFPSEAASESLELKALTLEAKADEFGLKRARASAWPELSLGPVMESEPGSAGRETFVGGALALQLPFWDRNGGEKRAAAARQKASRFLADAAMGLQQIRLERWRDRYQSAIPVLIQNVRTLEDGVEGLKSIKSAYLAGRLPVSSALEAFRQYFDAVEGSHSLEREAYESLWSAYALTGTALKRKP